MSSEKHIRAEYPGKKETSARSPAMPRWFCRTDLPCGELMAGLGIVSTDLRSALCRPELRLLGDAETVHLRHQRSAVG